MNRTRPTVTPHRAPNANKGDVQQPCGESLRGKQMERLNQRSDAAKILESRPGYETHCRSPCKANWSERTFALLLGERLRASWCHIPTEHPRAPPPPGTRLPGAAASLASSHCLALLACSPGNGGFASQSQRHLSSTQDVKTAGNGRGLSASRRGSGSGPRCPGSQSQAESLSRG